MADREIEEVENETRARGGKLTSEKKIAEVSMSKSKKRTKKALADSPDRAEAQNYLKTPLNLLKHPSSSHVSTPGLRFTQPLREILHTSLRFLRLFTPLYKSSFAQQ
jgi:hypothetical protein